MMPLKAAIRSHVASAEKRSWARQSPQCFREIWFCTQREWTETGVRKRTLREVVTDESSGFPPEPTRINLKNLTLTIRSKLELHMDDST